MSNINVRRAVESIRATTTVFTPIVEVIVNAIDAIEDLAILDGLIRIKVVRSNQQELDNDQGSRIVDIVGEDNGIGFTDENRHSFDTLYSDKKIAKGGKGFGRLTCLKYFDDVQFDSTYWDGAQLRRRKFEMGKKTEFIVNEKISIAAQDRTGTTVSLCHEHKEKLPRKLSSIARSLVEALLPYFTTEGYTCPRIVLSESDGGDAIVLNDYVDSEGAIIHEVTLPVSQFTLESTDGPEEFTVRAFKFLSPQNRASKVSLVADKREVTESSMATHIPEFADEFVEDPGGDQSRRRNYILKAYVFGPYLDRNVQTERGSFTFGRDADIVSGISQMQIEEATAELMKAAVQDEVTSRQERKREKLRNYIQTEAPWYKPVLPAVDMKSLSSDPTPSEMEALLHREKFHQEIKTRREVEAVLASENDSEILTKARELAERVSESSKNELVHYVALRRQVLELFSRSFGFKDDGKYPAEEVVHNLIFPTKSDNRTIGYDAHNLWILDERLTFTSYLSSDKALNGGNADRPDIIAFDRPVAFRGENETSNPVTIFEFKKPGRDNFVDPSSDENPIEQIVRYVNALRAGKYKTPEGYEVRIAGNTPIYGYVVCTLTSKVKRWLHEEMDFKPMPDDLGYFNWRGNINLYIEVLDWQKVQNDARMRNQAFFHMLGIQ